MNINDVKNLSDAELQKAISDKLKVNREYDFVGDLNVLYKLATRRGEHFEIAFTNNLYRVIGHHDHMEIEAVNAKPRLRAEAMLITLNTVECKLPDNLN